MQRYVTFCIWLVVCSFGNDVVCVWSFAHHVKRKMFGGRAKAKSGQEEEQVVRSRFNIRGLRYGAIHNSTIPTAQEAAQAVGVQPPMNAPSRVWKWAWRLHRAVLPWCHRFDKFKPTESSYSLQCLWLKALSGNDSNSPVFDNGLAHDVLPSATRVLVGNHMRGLYPRLHHANIEIRTAFLDQAVTDIATRVCQQNKSTTIRLVSLGAGYDTRSIKFRERGLVHETVELDLPRIVQAKSKILNSTRFSKRRNRVGQEVVQPQFYPVDLNDMDEVEGVLNQALTNTDENVHTIFLLEAVMIYLDKGVPSLLLQTLSSLLQRLGLEGTLCFADRLENVPGGDMELARTELQRAGWEMTKWQSKPGLARHMGCAQLFEKS